MTVAPMSSTWRPKDNVLARNGRSVSSGRIGVRRRRIRGRFGRRQRLPESRVSCLAVRHQLRADFRQGFACGRRLAPRLHDGNDAMDLQPNTFSSGTLYEAGLHAGRPDLSASPLILGDCIRHGCGHPKDETDRAKG